MSLEFDWPIQAEAFGENIAESKFLKDSFWESMLKKALNKESIIFIGKRGSGKTMLLRFAYSQMMRNFNEIRRLPVFISLTAFLARFSFPKIGEFSNQTKEIASELFKSYFHILILEEVIKSLKKCKIRPVHEFEIVGNLIKKKKNIDLKNILEIIKLRLQREIVPRSILKSYNKHNSLDLGGKIIGFSKSESEKTSINTIEFRILESDAEIRRSLENIIEAFNLTEIVLFFDEIPGLGYLQGDFFDILYIFRNLPSVIFKIGSYPHYTDLGYYFDIPDDAEAVNLDRKLFKPTTDEYYQYFKDFLALVLKCDEKHIFEEFFEESSLKTLAIASGGNPRLFLTFLKTIGEFCEGKIRNLDINRNIDILYNQNFYRFIKENSRRYNVDEDQCLLILDYVIERLGNRNKTKNRNTSFIGISNECYKNFEDSLNLLDYSRVLDFFDEKILSGQKRGKRYIINLIVAGANKTFKYANPGIRTQFHEDLLKDLEEMQSQDRKVIITKIPVEIEELPRAELKKSDPMEEDLNVLNFTTYITEKLKSNGYTTPSDLYQVSESDFKKIKGIGNVKAKMIKIRVEEYVSDNFI